MTFLIAEQLVAFQEGLSSVDCRVRTLLWTVDVPIHCARLVSNGC
jgi:hypothetical protein